MACDKLMTLDEPTQNGNSEKLIANRQAKIFFVIKSFHAKRSAEICPFKQGLGRQGIISLGYLYDCSITPFDEDLSIHL